MKITLKWLEAHDACKDGIDWWHENNFEKIDHADHAAELVLYIFEEKYPNDNRPRKAIEAAKKYLISKFTKNNAASASASAADAYAYAADAAKNGTKNKIIKYGLKLIEEQDRE